MVSLCGIKISHTYRFFKALKEVSLELQKGECYALFGPNGAGKTTLMKIFATLLQPTSGTVTIMGRDGVQDREEARRFLFFIGHGSFLYDDLTAIENIEFAIGLRGWLPTLGEIKMALDRVGIGPYASQKSRTLSTGMQKRLALAKAILAEPNLLLLDEPYASLDEKGIAIMNELICDFLKKGASVLLSSHDRAKTAEVATHAGILHNKGLREIPVTELAHALF
ncbi:MAG: heme ABC exporter ATP-binding protein CcmA [Nitrospirae bacterium]|nr:heme ABC exporter ATP-binding protein CcmA [Candidatus Troglogloeales bacterium]